MPLAALEIVGYILTVSHFRKGGAFNSEICCSVFVSHRGGSVRWFGLSNNTDAHADDNTAAGT